MFVNGRNMSSPTTTLIPRLNAPLPPHSYLLNCFQSPRRGPNPTFCILRKPLALSGPSRATVSANSSLHLMTSLSMILCCPNPPRTGSHPPPLYLPFMIRCLSLKMSPVSKLYPICRISDPTSSTQRNPQIPDLQVILVSTPFCPIFIPPLFHLPVQGPVPVTQPDPSESPQLPLEL